MGTEKRKQQKERDCLQLLYSIFVSLGVFSLALAWLLTNKSSTHRREKGFNVVPNC